MRKRIGILGGIGPASTAEYYRVICAEYFRLHGDYYYPEILIDSLDPQRFTDFEDNDDMESYLEYIESSLQRLNAGKADFALLSANSPHAVFDKIVSRSPLPLLSIVDPAVREAQRLNRNRLLILGIKFTMQSGFYEDAFRKVNIDTITPALSEQNEINHLIFGKLAQGIVEVPVKERLLSIISDYDIDGVVLGCTELPLILKSEDCEVPLLNTLELHAKMALEIALGTTELPV